MKKILYLIVALAFIGCSSETPLYDNQLNEIQSKYAESKEKVKEEIQQICGVLFQNNTRAFLGIESGRELFWYLINLPDSELDSLYNIYCSPENEAIIEEYYELNIEALINLTSAEDVQNFYSFIENYVQMGGHDLDYIEQELETTFSSSDDIIREGVIEGAVWCDDLMPDNPMCIDQHVKCLEEAQAKLASSKIADLYVMGTADTLYLFCPELGLADGAGGVLYSLYSMLELTHEYHMCLLKKAY